MRLFQTFQDALEKHLKPFLTRMLRAAPQKGFAATPWALVSRILTIQVTRTHTRARTRTHVPRNFEPVVDNFSGARVQTAASQGLTWRVTFAKDRASRFGRAKTSSPNTVRALPPPPASPCTC